MSIHTPPDQIPHDPKVVHNCKTITKDKNKCVEDKNTFLAWVSNRKSSSASFVSLYVNISECEKRCVEHPSCVQVTFSSDNSCSLATYGRYGTGEYLSRILHCCHKYDDIPVDPKGDYVRCQNDHASLKNCHPKDSKYLVWKMQEFQKKSFNTQWKYEGKSLADCKEMCVREYDCRQISFNNNNNQCLLGKNEAFHESEDYHSGVLYCCEKYEIPFGPKDAYDCKEEKKDKRKCAEDKNSFLGWRKKRAVGHHFLRLKDSSIADCQKRCAEDSTCAQVTYHENKECSLSTYNMHTPHPNIISHIIYCCHKYDIPVDPPGDYVRCKNDQTSLQRCHPKDSKYLIWKMQEFQNKSFHSQWKYEPKSLKECRKLCAREYNCRQISFNNNNNQCLLGFHETLEESQDYHSSVLYCCEKYEIPIDPKDSFHCKEITNDKRKCAEDENTFVAWKKKQATTSFSFLDLNVPISECLQRCAEEPTCVQVSIFNTTTRCYISTYNTSVPDPNERSYVMHCCSKYDVPVDPQGDFVKCKNDQTSLQKCHSKDSKYLFWKMQEFQNKSFDTEQRRGPKNLKECKDLCARRNNCSQISFNNNNECLLGLNEVLYESQSYHSSILYCCEKYEIFHDRRDVVNCHQVKENKRKCFENERKFLVYKTHEFTSFESIWKINANPDNCRTRCKEEPNCLQIKYLNNNPNECWLASNEITYANKSYNSSILYCCQADEIPVGLHDVFNCEQVKGEEKMCKNENKFLTWIEKKKESFDSERRIWESPDNCRKRCRDDPSCLQVSYNGNNECWLSTNLGSYENDNYDSAFLSCCQKYDIPVDPKDVFNCQEIKNSKQSCIASGGINFLAWKTKTATTFNTQWKFFESEDNCRKRCADTKDCLQVTYNKQENVCYFGKKEVSYLSNSYNASFLFCCQSLVDIPVGLKEVYNCDQTIASGNSCTENKFVTWRTVETSGVITHNSKSDSTRPYCCHKYDIPVDRKNVANCEMIKENIENCMESEKKFLVYKTHNFTSFDSQWKIRATPNDCRKICASEKNCSQIKFNNANDCWLSWNENIYHSDIYTASILFCCEDYDISLNIDYTHDCERITNWKKNCSEDEVKTPVWKTNDLERSFFNTTWKIKATPYDCRMKCANEDKCNQIAYNAKNVCLLGLSLPLFETDYYTTAYLYCCAIEKRMRVHIDSRTYHYPAPTTDEFSIVIQHKRFPNCIHNKFISIHHPRGSGKTFTYESKIKYCPKIYGDYDFMLTIICESHNESYTYWTVNKFEVQIAGHKKFCFPKFEEGNLCSDLNNSEIRKINSQPCS